jgi:IS4 transposase
VRFVRVKLSTNKDEILATSWLHKQQNTTDFFSEIYHLRWGVETRYALLKTRLELENFSGKTVTSVLQDFYATLYLTSLESLPLS